MDQFISKIDFWFAVISIAFMLTGINWRLGEIRSLLEDQKDNKRRS